MKKRIESGNAYGHSWLALERAVLKLSRAGWQVFCIDIIPWHNVSLCFCLQIVISIRHFRVRPGLCIKTRLSAQPLIWKWFFILMQIKLISTRKVEHLASFWKWGFWNSEVAYYITIFFKNVHKTVLIVSHSSTENKPPIFNAYSLIFKSWVSSHYFYFEFILTPLHRLLILPLRPRMWNLQSNSQPGNKMSALKYFRDLSTSHPRHLDRVSSSLKCISPKMFFTSKGIGIPSSDCSEFLFATHTYVKKDGLYCEIWHMNIWTWSFPK